MNKIMKHKIAYFKLLLTSKTIYRCYIYSKKKRKNDNSRFIIRWVVEIK